MSKPAHHRMIARLDPAARRAVLTEAARQLRGRIAQVHYSYRREDAGHDYVSGVLLGVAWAPGTGTGEALIVRDVDVLYSLSPAHLIRIVDLDGNVIAGPPMPGQLEERHPGE